MRGGLVINLTNIAYVRVSSKGALREREAAGRPTSTDAQRGLNAEAARPAARGCYAIRFRAADSHPRRRTNTSCRLRTIKLLWVGSGCMCRDIFWDFKNIQIYFELYLFSVSFRNFCGTIKLGDILYNFIQLPFSILSGLVIVLCYFRMHLFDLSSVLSP